MSYLMLKKMNPNTGKKKNRPKIKLSFAYKFFFFKKRSPNPSPVAFVFSGVFDLLFQTGHIGKQQWRLAFILDKKNFN